MLARGGVWARFCAERPAGKRLSDNLESRRRSGRRKPPLARPALRRAADFRPEPGVNQIGDAAALSRTLAQT